MSESYTVGGDSLQPIGVQYYAGQSFTPTRDHILNFIDINLRSVELRRAPTIWVYKADANHKPIGNYLSESIRHRSEKGNIYNVFRERAAMEPVLLYAGTRYVIIIHAFALDAPYHLRWQFDAGDATYPRGMRIISTDGGLTWAQRPGDDHIFAEFGTPPSPPPPPEPPIEKFIPTKLTYIQTLTGLKIVLGTNVPCHLYLYWTTTEPLKHPLTRVRRGLAVPWYTRYCFVNYHENEQEEPGDTLYHTFIKEPWPVCETRWFTIRGNIDEELSPSVGPIFKKHRALLPITITVYPDNHPETTSVDGIVGYRYDPGIPWDEIHNAEGNYAVDDVTPMNIYAIHASYPFEGWKGIIRSIFLFDTSIIPPGATILNAKVEHYGVNKFIFALPGLSVAIFSSNPASNTQLIPADYQTLATTPLSNEISYDDFNPAGWNTFTLNAAGLAAITPGGITKLGAREANYDAPNIAPPWQGLAQNYCDIKYAEDPDEIKPKLTITYLPA